MTETKYYHCPETGSAVKRQRGLNITVRKNGSIDFSTDSTLTHEFYTGEDAMFKCFECSEEEFNALLFKNLPALMSFTGLPNDAYISYQKGRISAFEEAQKIYEPLAKAVYK